MYYFVKVLLVFASTILSATNSAQQEGKVDLDDVQSRCWARRGQFPHATFCDWFYNCWDGAVYEQGCPRELAFNPSIQACDYPANVDCRQRILSWNLEKNPRCPKSSGVFPDRSRGCSAFVICDRGSPVEFSCGPPDNLHFNPATSVCDYPSKLWPPCQDYYPSTDGFNCPDADGIFAHEEDCSKFWTCIDGRATLTACPSPTLFDVRYARCVDPVYAHYDYQLPVNAALGSENDNDVDLVDKRHAQSSGNETATTMRETVKLTSK